MDVERHLICRIIQDSDFGKVGEAGITAEFFLKPENRRVFEAMLSHRAEYGETPTLAIMRADFPTYKFSEVEETAPVLIDRLRERRKKSLLEMGLQGSVEALDDGQIDEAAAQVQQALTRIAGELPSTRDVEVARTLPERFKAYMEITDLPNGLRGIPTGFQTLDHATQGLQKEQLITLVGPPKAGKSTLLLLVAIAAHRAGLKPLVFTFEMSNDEMTARMDAIRAGVSHRRLLEGTLRPQEKRKFDAYQEELDELPEFWFSADSRSATTLGGITAKTESLRPDIVFIDGVYLLDDENGEPKGSPQALTNLTRGFKRLAQNKEIPVVISTQVLESKMSKTQGITSNSIGYSSSFAQDSDVVIGVQRTEEPDVQTLKVVLARNSPPLEKKVRWDWDSGTFEELDDEDDNAWS